MPTSKTEAFLTKQEEQEIVDAILEAERTTSGEIRVHIEARAGADAFGRASELFFNLKMDNTRDKNGVLFYVAVKDQKFAIIGDSGINKTVPPNFWEDTKAVLESHFKRKEFKNGLIAAILKAGQELKAHFPWNPGDKNELGNEISKG